MTDLRTLLGPLGVQGVITTRPADEIRPITRRIAELGYGSLWVGDTVGRDPFAQLAAVADVAGGMVLGTNIANIFGRDAMATRMGAMTLHELTAGRFVLGLGVSHEHLVAKLRGHEYDKPLTRMREYLTAYRSLPYKGPAIAGPDGEATEPRLVIAALRTKMTRLAATDAAGALPWFVPVARVATMRALLDESAPSGAPRPLLALALPAVLETDAALARAAARQWSEPYARAVNYRNNLAECGYDEADWTQPMSDRLLDDIVAWGDRDAIRTRIAELHDAGADHIMLAPIDAVGGSDQLSTLEALAPGA